MIRIHLTQKVFHNKFSSSMNLETDLRFADISFLLHTYVQSGTAISGTVQLKNAPEKTDKEIVRGACERERERERERDAFKLRILVNFFQKTLKKHLSVKLVYLCVSKEQEIYYFASRRNFACGHTSVPRLVLPGPQIPPIAIWDFLSK